MGDIINGIPGVRKLYRKSNEKNSLLMECAYEFSMADELIFMKNKNAVQKMTQETMSGKVCVVTGSTSGLAFRQ